MTDFFHCLVLFLRLVIDCVPRLSAKMGGGIIKAFFDLLDYC